MRRLTYFHSPIISKPRNSNAASPLIQPCNRAATIGSFARADRLALFFSRMSKPRNSNGLSPLI